MNAWMMKGGELQISGQINDGHVRIVGLNSAGRVLPILNVEWLEANVTGLAIWHRKGKEPPNKGKKYPPTPPTPEEVIRLLDCLPDDMFGERDRALIILLWRTGLRVSEATALKPFHVDLAERTITVECGKGSKFRVVGIDPWGVTELKRWVAYRDGLDLPASAPFFCTLFPGTEGRRLNTNHVRTVLHRLREKAGIPHRVAPHQLRHALAVGLAREHVDMHLIQRQLGHSNLAVTAGYLSAIAPAEVIEVAPAEVIEVMGTRPAPQLLEKRSALEEGS